MYKHNPGSYKAVKLGCLCPIIDNGHGMGAFGMMEEPVFWIEETCPMHGQATFA